MSSHRGPSRWPGQSLGDDAVAELTIRAEDVETSITLTADAVADVIDALDEVRR